MNDSDTVTLCRAQYEALLDRLEDAEDMAIVAAAEAREAALGKRAARAGHLPLELIERLDAGEHPIRVWRRHRGLSRQALGAAACIAPSYVSEIETRRKRGSFDAIIKLAAALDAPLVAVAAWMAAR